MRGGIAGHGEGRWTWGLGDAVGQRLFGPIPHVSIRCEMELPFLKKRKQKELHKNRTLCVKRKAEYDFPAEVTYWEMIERCRKGKK